MPRHPATALTMRLTGRAGRRLERVPAGWRLAGVALLAVVAAGLADVTARDQLSPAHVAGLSRSALVAALVAAGVYTHASRLQARMGTLLIGTGLLSALWLLNGSSDRTVASIGRLCAGTVPLAIAYVLLAHPTGHLSLRVERRFLAIAGGTLALLWLLGLVFAGHHPLPTPVLACAPACPASAFSVGSPVDVGDIVRAGTTVVWLALSLGVPVLLWRRASSRPAPVRRSLAPVLTVAAVAAVLRIMYLIAVNAGSSSAGTIGVVYVAFGVAIPVGVLLGLSRERLFMGQTLADFVNLLARAPQAEPESLMAAALRDPSLRIAYRRPRRSAYVDAKGEPVLEVPDDQAVTWIERNQRPVAAVMYDRELADYQGFVQAAGAAALIHLESAQLEADLKASTSELAASRVRLIDIAATERRRLERDLHDGVQQHLVGLRIRLALAADAVKGDPGRAEGLLAAMGTEMDDVLDEVRSLARGIYPSLLSQYGLTEALRAAGGSSTIPVEVLATRLARYPDEVEVGVYFCCLEALQNVAEHGGPGASAKVRLWQTGSLLRFEVRDSGAGFTPAQPHPGRGLETMRDRIEAVGGTLEVSSHTGGGTRIRGSVPVA